MDRDGSGDDDDEDDDEGRAPPAPAVDETIRLARESIRRRRTELLARKDELIASYRNREGLTDDDAGRSGAASPPSSPSSTPSSSPSAPSRRTPSKPTEGDDDGDSARAALARGRALLAEAEARSEFLGRYAASGTSVGTAASTTRDDRVREVDAGLLVSEDDSTGGRSSGEDDFMSRFLRETSRAVRDEGDDDRRRGPNAGDPSSESRRVVPELPVEVPDWDDDLGAGGGSDASTSRPPGTPEGSDELRRLLREGEARARLDELIATVRRRGDDLPRPDRSGDGSGDGGSRGECGTPKRTPSSGGSFDPSSLKAARRAALRRVKWDEELAAAEEEARRRTSFKALPLPGGGEVAHDLRAPTRAFEGKRIGSVEKLVRRDSKRDRGARRDGGRDDDDDGCASSSASGTFGSGVLDGISIVSSKGTVMSRDDEDFGGSSPGGRAANEADREQARQLRAEKRSKKRQLLDVVNRTIDEGDEDAGRTAVGDDAESGIVVEDPAKLRQEIARLEARLKQKKTQRLATLNDIVDIDLNALFDRLVSDETGDEAKRIVDRLKDRVCGGANDFHRRIAPDADDGGCFEVEAPNVRKSLFARHSDWALEREEKLRDARTRLESEAMHGVTGRPELSHAERSWRKAKESHDEAMRMGAEEEERRRRASDQRERASDERKRLEMEELRRRADERLKATAKADATDPEERRRRLEELSRPRRTRDAAVAGGDEGTDAAVCDRRADGLPSKSKIFLPTGGSAPKRISKPADVVGGRFDGRFGGSVEKRAKENLDPAPPPPERAKPDAFCGTSTFSEMTDREFVKLVKRIGKDASARAKERTSDVRIVGNPDCLAMEE